MDVSYCHKQEQDVITLARYTFGLICSYFIQCYPRILIYTRMCDFEHECRSGPLRRLLFGIIIIVLMDFAADPHHTHLSI